MKTFKGIYSIAADIALRKQRAGKARFGRTKSEAGKAREVYLEGCAAIGQALAKDGFVYSKSGPRMRRPRGEFVDEIAFQSSPHNVAGEYVALYIHAYVRSKRFHQWKKDHPYPGMVASDLFAGGQIGNLVPRFAWLEWNLATNRTRVLRDALRTIRAIALPYFEMFDDLDVLASRAVSSEIPGLSPDSTVEFLLCFASRRAAESAITNSLRRRPDLKAPYLEALRTYRVEGPPDYYPNGWAMVLAKATVVFDLTPSVAARA